MTARSVVAFRVDASVRMGTGHTVRCLTLADELRGRGAECHFIQRSLDGHLMDIIQAQGFRVHALDRPTDAGATIKDGDYRAWAGVAEMEDASDCLPILDGIGARQVIIDHYGFGAAWHSRVRHVVTHVTAIDDLANRPLDCDVLIDQNFVQGGSSRYDGLVSPTCKRLCGPEYALLAPEYARARKFTRPRRGPVSRVLVFYGGSDPTDETGLALRVLCRPEFTHLAVDVVVGRNYLKLAALRELAAERRGVEVHQSLPTLLPLMLEADLAIGAGGATMWERCCVGLPAIVTPIAQNQVPASRHLSQSGGCVLLPAVADESASCGSRDDELASAIRSLCGDQRVLNQMAEVIWSLGEGTGVRSVAEILMPPDHAGVRLRTAKVSDETLCSRWANNEAKTPTEASSKQIAWQPHSDWFRNRTLHPDSYLWIMETRHGVPLGQFSVDIADGKGLVSFSVDTAFRDRAIGRQLVELGIEAWRRLETGVPLALASGVGTDRAREDFRMFGDLESKGQFNRTSRYALSVLSDSNSWINRYINSLVSEWLDDGHQVLWTHSPAQLRHGDFLFLLGCGQVISESALALHRHNLVVHESALPKGKGWSPMSWQVLQGADQIPVTLLEAVARVDSGQIYAHESIVLSGTEFVDELRSAQADATARLCRWFVESYPPSSEAAHDQQGEESFFARRTPEDSRLDPSRSIAEQFDLLRIVDNDRYPAFFEHRGVRVELRIMKCDKC